MKIPFFLLFLTLPVLANEPAPIPPDEVVIVFNEELAESKDLAKTYAKARGIPSDNLFGLKVPDTDEISRADFNSLIRDPLAAEFLRRGWLTRKLEPGRGYRVTSSKPKVLVTMRGIPFKIPSESAEADADKGKRWHLKQDDASVDSELALLGTTAHGLAGPVANPFYKSKDPITAFEGDPTILVGRIDGPTWERCKEMIEEAIAVEETGLWGMCYLDFARKTEQGYQIGDDWIESIARTNRDLGIPTVTDRHRDTFVTNYPMSRAALYFGWYITDRNGPFLNEEFRLQKGAVAVHIHSFSATQLRDPDRHWTGPLLAKGAAATVGNVWEPFLQLTHNLDILHERLLAGHSFIEAAYMANPSLSWQGVAIGDPLYRPFPVREDFTSEDPEIAPFLTLREAFKNWGDDQETLVRKLRTTAAKEGSGLFYEALGLALRESNETDQAAAFFESAGKYYKKSPDKLRQKIHLIDMAREAGRNQEAITMIRSELSKFSNVPEGKALAALLIILDPPAPPPVSPTAKNENTGE